MRRIGSKLLSYSGNEVKLRDVVSSLRETSKATGSSIRSWLRDINQWYEDTYYKKGKVDPLVHYMLLCFGVGYTINYSHIKHKVEHKNDDIESL
ncbi:hypothetical protein GAYE_SCF18G3844 [Galdieria yellowstonensis]|uniref:ATP synthase subunit f, mitochondrial n=1 Tax=Galdieria yellowstonensis TaxID=3028027 RepID=A0AAV9IEY7_9RHOD|nr:hypothetical protein GAYE_SCF18G3844 [Galdieria yellowstonensis]